MYTVIAFPEDDWQCLCGRPWSIFQSNQGPESHEKPQETAAEEDSSENNYDTQNSLDNEFENLLPDVQVSAVILSVYLKDICNKKI